MIHDNHKVSLVNEILLILLHRRERVGVLIDSDRQKTKGIGEWNSSYTKASKQWWLQL